MAKQYSTYTDIVVDGSGGPADYETKVTNCLKMIEDEWPSGKPFLRDINQTKKRLTIGPRDAGYGSNYCDPSGTAGYTLLTRAIRQNDDQAFKSALGAALNTASKAGVTVKFVASKLAMGLLPVTYDTKQNVGKLTPKTSSDGQAGQTQSNINILEALVNGTRTMSTGMPAGWGHELQRILRPWLQPGRGCACTIGFDPDQTYPCDADPARRNRPPVIGLAHEMVHAWHFMTGKVLDVETPNFDLEEVITTGFAPYNFEPYSENLFRTQFKNQSLIVRETYSWLPGRGRAVPTTG